MIQPPISDLLKKVENRYTLVIATAKRARMLTGGGQPLTETTSGKPVTVAIHEINEGKVRYHKIQKEAATKNVKYETNMQEETLNGY